MRNFRCWLVLVAALSAIGEVRAQTSTSTTLPPNRPPPDPIHFPKGSDMKVYDKAKEKIEKVQKNLQKGGGVKYTPPRLNSKGELPPNPWKNGNPNSDRDWETDSRKAIFGNIGGTITSAGIPNISLPELPENFPPGVPRPPNYNPSDIGSALTNLNGGLLSAGAQFTHEALAIFFDCFAPKVSYDLHPDASLGCPYCTINTKGANWYEDLVADVCGVADKDNRGYMVDFWWPEYEIDLNNFSVNAFRPEPTCGGSAYTRALLETQIDQMLRPTFLQVKASREGVTKLPTFPPGLRSRPNLGQSHWDGLAPWDDVAASEAHVYRSYLSVAASMSRPRDPNKGYLKRGGECCFYNALAKPPVKHPLVNGWTEKFSASAFWRTEELSVLFDKDAYNAVHPPGYVKLTVPYTVVPFGCTAYRAGQMFSTENDYRDLQEGFGIAPLRGEIYKKICYPGGGDLFPVTGKMSASFAHLPAAAYLSRRAVYMFGKKRVGFGSQPITSPIRRIQRYNDEFDKLQRVSPGVSRCFGMKDVPNFLGGGKGNFPDDIIRPDQNGSIRYIYWNHRRACMCPYIGPAILGLGFLPFCQEIKPACFWQEDGDKEEGDENQFAVFKYPSPIPPPGVPYPFFDHPKCKLCKTTSQCEKTSKPCGRGDYDEGYDGGGNPEWWLWLMRGITVANAILNPSTFAGVGVGAFLRNIPGQLRTQLIGMLQQMPLDIRDHFMGALAQLQNLPEVLQQEFLEIAAKFDNPDDLRNFLQATTGMTEADLRKFLKDLESLPENLQSTYLELAKTPEGRRQLAQLGSQLAPNEFSQLIETVAGMSNEDFKKFADAFSNLDSTMQTQILALARDPAARQALIGMIEQVSGQAVPGVFHLAANLDEQTFRNIADTFRNLDSNLQAQFSRLLEDPQARQQFVDLLAQIDSDLAPSFVRAAAGLTPQQLTNLSNIYNDPRAREQLINIIDQVDRNVVPGAIRGLAQLTPQQVSNFQNVWRDQQARQDLIRVINGASSEDLVPGIVQFAADIDPAQVRAAARAISSLDGSLQDQFVAHLRNPESRAQLANIARQVAPGTLTDVFAAAAQLDHTQLSNFSSIMSNDRTRRQLFSVAEELAPDRVSPFLRAAGEISPQQFENFARNIEDANVRRQVTETINTAFPGAVPGYMQFVSTLSREQIQQANTAFRGLSSNGQQTFSQFATNPAARAELARAMGQIAPNRFSSLIEQTAGMSNEQFVQMGRTMRNMPGAVQDNVLATMRNLPNQGQDLARYIETVGEETFIRQAQQMPPEQLAQLVRNTLATPPP